MQQEQLEQLRSAALQHNSTPLQRVEVNQRALIDKILARYAAKHAVYRELLANSDDACASNAEIHLTTEDSTVTSVVYRNNGTPFRKEDWERLQKIAEGNPDESKIGAFGVGVSSCDVVLRLSSLTRRV